MKNQVNTPSEWGGSNRLDFIIKSVHEKVNESTNNELVGFCYDIKVQLLNLKAEVNTVQEEKERLIAERDELKKLIEDYKECFEKFIPSDKWDEATIFLDSQQSGLAKAMANKEFKHLK